MIDFILAGVLYLGVMFVVSFCLAFVTIGITYFSVSVFRRWVRGSRQPQLAAK